MVRVFIINVSNPPHIGWTEAMMNSTTYYLRCEVWILSLPITFHYEDEIIAFVTHVSNVSEILLIWMSFSKFESEFQWIQSFQQPNRMHFYLVLSSSTDHGGDLFFFFSFYASKPVRGLKHQLLLLHHGVRNKSSLCYKMATLSNMSPQNYTRLHNTSGHTCQNALTVYIFEAVRDYWVQSNDFSLLLKLLHFE